MIEENEVQDCGTGDLTFLSRSVRNGRIVVFNNSDDDDDRVIEMTGGGGLLVSLVIDFYVNDDNDNHAELRVDIHTREQRCLLLTNYIHTRGWGRFFLSHSQLLLLL